jgi:hypothetical protein
MTREAPSVGWNAPLGPHLDYNFLMIPVHAPGARTGDRPGERSFLMPHRCGACEAEDQEPLRVASDNDDDSLPYPRAEGHTPAPAPPVFPPNPPPPVTEATCCDKALQQGLDGGDYGGIICCKNRRNVCVWQSNINKTVTNSKAQKIVGKCVRAHEKTHKDQVECTGADVERPPFKPGVDPKKAECDAYKVEVQCYKDSIDDCNTDSDCRKQVQKEWDFAKKQIKKYC